MSADKRFKFAIALVMAFTLGACDLLGGDKTRDVLWQAEVEAVAMSAHADAAVEGNIEAFDSVRASRDAVEAALGTSASKPVPADVGSAWAEARSIADVVLSHQAVVLNMVAAEAEFSAAVPQMMARIDEVGRSVSEGEPRATPTQIYLLGRTQVLLERMQRRLGQVRAGGVDAISAADAFARDNTILERTLAGLQDGDAELAIEAIAAPQAHASLIEVRQLLTETQSKAEPLLTGIADMVEAREAADSLPGAVDALRSSLQHARVRR